MRRPFSPSTLAAWVARITTSMRIGVSRTSTLHKRSGEFSPGPAGHGGRSRIGRDSPGVAVLAQLAAEELVELGPEDAIGDELPLLAHRLGASRHRGLSYAAKDHEELEGGRENWAASADPDHRFVAFFCQ